MLQLLRSSKASTSSLLGEAKANSNGGGGIKFLTLYYLMFIFFIFLFRFIGKIHLRHLLKILGESICTI